jgi:hypothetical protein
MAGFEPTTSRIRSERASQTAPHPVIVVIAFVVPKLMNAASWLDSLVAGEHRRRRRRSLA